MNGAEAILTGSESGLHICFKRRMFFKLLGNEGIKKMAQDVL
jgi:hypothetical protein